MKGSIRLAIAIMLLSAAAALATTGHSHLSDKDPIGAIERDYAAGELTYSQKALLQIKAIKRPSELPAKYQLFDLATGVSHARCATDAIVDIKQNWAQLDGPTQQEITTLLQRWSTAFTYNSPGGFFKLHYDVTGTNAVPSADGNGNTIPDYVEKCAAYMDSSLAKHQAMGYLNPPSDGSLGGDALFDVYFEEMGYYGYAVPEGAGPNPWPDYYSHLVLHRDFLGFPPNDDPEGNQAGAAKATAAHEFHHCIQFAYDATESSWFMELDATYMEDIVFDQVNDNYNYLDSYMDDPQISLMDQSIHMYASFIWGMYLAERFDTTLMRACWNGARYKSVYDAMSDSLLAIAGYSQDSAFAEFAVWNYFTGFRDLGQHYGEGDFYPPMTVDRQHTTYPTNNQLSPVNPQGYGACYIEFIPTVANNKLRLTFDGGDAAQWAAYLIKFTNPTTYTLEKLVLPSSPWIDTTEVLNYNTYTKVVLVAVNINQFGGGTSFNYSASLAQPLEMSSTISGGSPVYSGNQRTCSVLVKNIGTINNSIKVTYSDALGWVTPGEQSRFLTPGDSSFVTFLVKPPVGTPLGSNSYITANIVSLLDTTLQQTRNTNATTVVYRGDVNFSGSVDISDLSALIAYVLGLGGQPQPTMDAGNVDCAGAVDLSDLSYMISHFISGTPESLCNPY